MQYLQIKLPFEGFYYSIIDSLLDNIIEWEKESQEKDDLDCEVDHTKVAKLYVDQYQKWLDEEHEVSVALHFNTLTSPRFYNYQTDEITVGISKSDATKLYDKLMSSPENKIQEYIDRVYKSRSGFVSFYDDFCTEWKTKQLSEWDENELYALFPSPDYNEIYEDIDCNGELSGCIYFT